jgi:hypothetical protein
MDFRDDIGWVLLNLIKWAVPVPMYQVSYSKMEKLKFMFLVMHCAVTHNKFSNYAFITATFVRGGFIG